MAGKQPPSNHAARQPARLPVPPPQGKQLADMRNLAYSHVQSQWCDVEPAPRHQENLQEEVENEEEGDNPLPSTMIHRSRIRSSCSRTSSSHALLWSPTEVRPPPVAAPGACTTCLQPHDVCACNNCFVCQATLLKRHHCPRCRRAVCDLCWGATRYVYMLGQPMVVCDRCAVLRGLANIFKYDESGMLWGLYALRIAAEMPRICIGPTCRTFTRRLVCCACGLPTVTTQPHVSPMVCLNGVSNITVNTVHTIDVQQLILRAMEVKRMTTADMEKVFRRSFPRYEEVVAFRKVTTATMAQRILLASVAAAVAYEYTRAPNVTLALLDTPFARVLQVLVSRKHYTILEAPGRVKFVAFPGAYDWRSWWAGARFFPIKETVCLKPHDGVRTGPNEPSLSTSSRPASLCGDVRKTWTYRVHSGIVREAQEAGLPLDELLEDVRHGGCSLVLCGHSLGGTVAQYYTLQLLHRAADLLMPADPSPAPRIMCITFGAPLLGNYELADHIRICGWTNVFHNFVYRCDVVPRFFCADNIALNKLLNVWQFATTRIVAARNWCRGVKGGDIREGEGSTNLATAMSDPAVLCSLSTERMNAPSAANNSSPVATASAATSTKRSLISKVLSTAAKASAVLLFRSTGCTSEAPLLTAGNGGVSKDVTGWDIINGEADEVREARLATYMHSVIRNSNNILREDEENGDSEVYKDGSTASMRNNTNNAKTADLQNAEVEAALTAFANRRRMKASKDASDIMRARSDDSNNSINEAGNVAGDAAGNNTAYSHREGKAAEEEEDGKNGGTNERTRNKVIEGNDLDSITSSLLPTRAGPRLRRSRLGSEVAAAAPAVPADVAADIVIPTRRAHSRFSCFGRYHFLQYGCYGYVSTDDSETAFAILKLGCGGVSGVSDHSLVAYDRGMMIHLYRNSD